MTLISCIKNIGSLSNGINKNAILVDNNNGNKDTKIDFSNDQTTVVCPIDKDHPNGCETPSTGNGGIIVAL